jgi:hypothetical protein
MISPPETAAQMVVGCGAFGGLPKQIAAKPAVASCKPATTVAAAESRVKEKSPVLVQRQARA